MLERVAEGEGVGHIPHNEQQSHGAQHAHAGLAAEAEAGHITLGMPEEDQRALQVGEQHQADEYTRQPEMFGSHVLIVHDGGGKKVFILILDVFTITRDLSGNYRLVG